MIKTKVFQINPTTFEDTSISIEDASLITTQQLDEQFDTNNNQVELYLYLPPTTLVGSYYNYSGWKTYQDPALPSTGKLQDLYINPEIDSALAEVSNGDVYAIYNFVNNELQSSIDQPFYISSISSNRTEVLIKTNNLPNQVLAQLLNEFIVKRNQLPYFGEFYLNFGNNQEALGINIQLDTTDPASYGVLVKLYDPLPSTYDLKSQCWIQTRIADPVGYRVNYTTIVEIPDSRIQLRQPNFNLPVFNRLGNSTNYENLTTLKTTSVTGSVNQVDSILVEKGVELNIDYSDYNNFVHFSSATTRLANFYYKAGLIETYQNDINSLLTTPSTVARSESIATKQAEISKLITQFDGYDYYLYYESSSTAWPKTNNTPPFSLATTGSTAVLNWAGLNFDGSLSGTGQFATASLYDSENQDNLVNSIPEYLVEDSENAPYQVFLELVGQHFDTLYLYTDAISDKYNADNRLEYGVSKDLIADVLKSFGIKIYENNFSTSDLYTGLIGLTPSGSTLLLPDITTIFPVTGSGIEYITTIVSASNDLVTLDDLNKSIYKRLYHNLPLLVKKKGTLAGLELLRTIYGIPDTILRIQEFGGKDKDDATWDQWENTYNYAFDTKGGSSVKTTWQINSAWSSSIQYPDAVALRIRPGELPRNASQIPYSQSIWKGETLSEKGHLLLTYTGQGYISSSYSASVIDPYYQYARLDFIPNDTTPTVSASVYLPFFNGDWWSIMFTGNSPNTLVAKNSNGNKIGFQASSSVTTTSAWGTYYSSSFASGSTFAGSTYTNFTGSIQEIRYYTPVLNDTAFDSFVMNPSSIQGNTFNQSPDQLVFRAALGGELYTGSTSIHPKVSGQWQTTASFASNSNFTVSGSGQFEPNREVYYYNQVPAGIKNAITNKVRIENTTPYQAVLSNQISIQQNTPISQSYTSDVNYLEVGFSPSNEINDDINSQLGYFNIGEYIGDPRFISESNYRYPDLNAISVEYFKKYTQSYDLEDYFRLIKFFDNSLFKLIKDFIPARTGAATGAIVKQHLLERNRQRPAQVSYTQPEYTASVTSVARDYQTGSIGVFTGGPGGSVNALTSTSQSWSSSILTPEGLVNQINSSQYEFFNGEYSGSSIPAKPIYELNLEPLLNNATGSRISTYYQDVDYNQNALNPTNFSTIITNSATRAAVQDSNYSSGSVWVNARYGGSRLSSKLYNRYTAGDVSYGKTAAIDNYSNYIAQFDWIGGSNPQYPGGGNIHIIGLIHIDGTVIGLDGSNSNLNLVEQIFRQGDLATAYISSYSSNQSVGTLEIETGGALYDTIMFKSGSITAFDGLSVSYSSSGTSYTDTYFITGSSNTLTDSGSGNAGWLYALITGSSPTAGPVLSYSTGFGNALQIFNKTTGQFGIGGSSIPAVDTYFPLQYGDFIRFGYSSGGVNDVDYSFEGTALFRLQKALTGSDYNDSSSLLVPSSIVTSFPSVQTDQNYRIFRRVPNETFVLVKKKPIYAGGGLLIPANFNPNYNPIDVARKAGVTL